MAIMTHMGIFISFLAPLLHLHTISGMHHPVQKYSVDSRIIGGRPAIPGEFPYQLQLRQVNYGHICGAALVLSPTSGNQIALTAAHCVVTKYYKKTFPVNYLELRAGITEVNQPGQSMGIQKIVVHPDYVPLNNKAGSENDFAIIILKGQFELNDYVQPIALPKESQVLPAKLTVSGWGATNSSQLDGSENKLIYDSNFCAGYEKGEKSACAGDSGGPSVVFENGKEPYLAGVSSFGNEICDAPKSPDVFIRVSSYLDWIKEAVLQYENENSKGHTTKQSGGRGRKLVKNVFRWKNFEKKWGLAR